MTQSPRVKIALDNEVIVNPSSEDETMARRSATFQEVSISLSAPPKLQKQENSDDSHTSVPENINTMPKSTLRPWSFINRVRSLPKMAGKIQARRGSTKSSSSAITIQDFDSDSGGERDGSPSREMTLIPPPAKKHSLTPSQINLLAIGRPLSQLKKVIASATKHRKNNTGDESPSKGISKERTENERILAFQNRIDSWAKALRDALQEDMQGKSIEAFESYRKFNIQVTREAIYNYEQFTCDQQKLLTQVMVSLDRRCKVLEHHISTSSFDSSDNLTDNAPSNNLSELSNCIRLLNAVKTIGSNSTMPVVLVYREKHHRRRHRDDQKGKSNKVVFAKEKRDFLQMLGLPGVMVTEHGIDYSIKPHFQDNVNGIPIKMSREPSNQDYQAISQMSSPERSKDAETSFSSASRTMLTESRRTPRRDESKMSLVHCLGFRKRRSVSPQPEDTSEDRNGNHYRSNQTLSIAEWTDIDSSSAQSDSQSMLSCDSCSSNESRESDYEIENFTDTAVLANYTHRESVRPPPFQKEGGTYIILTFEKVGLKKTSLTCPFMRISIKDISGDGFGIEQETRPWDVINRHYLRAPSSIFIQEPWDSLPDDSAIFFEIRHFIQARRKVSTHCYTFLEKSVLRNGEFICEIYRPPVDFTRRKLIPYSEKALFLHLEIKLEET